MKLLGVILLLCVTAGIALAQTPGPLSDAPNLSVDKFSWRRDVFVPALYDDPMAPNQEQVDLKREQRAIAKANKVRTATGQGALPLPTREIAASQREMPGGPSVNFIYQAKIRNTGDKTVLSVTWEYAVTDVASGVEIGSHRFIDFSKIRPGKTATLIGYSSTPAMSVLTANSEKDSRAAYSERVTINRIEYTDGTYWQRPLSEH